MTLTVGTLVRALDRDNYGRIVDTYPNGEASVFFRSQLGDTATVRIPVHLLEPVERARITAQARAKLARVTETPVRADRPSRAQAQAPVLSKRLRRQLARRGHSLRTASVLGEELADATTRIAMIAHQPTGAPGRDPRIVAAERLWDETYRPAVKGKPAMPPTVSTESSCWIGTPKVARATHDRTPTRIMGYEDAVSKHDPDQVRMAMVRPDNFARQHRGAR